MARNKSQKPLEHVEIDDHRIDLQWLRSGLADELVLDNTRESTSPAVKKTAI
jgi:hypothetical protein